jgi:Mor family transcriptional regulator
VTYVNAEQVLPAELIRDIQKYVDGQPLYIPRKNERKKAWGEKNGTREALKKRNRDIYTKFLDGSTIDELTKTYYLSEKSIQRIIRQEKLRDN